MQVLVELFLVFFKIGLFSFGGGYAMIPMMQSEVLGRGWMSPGQFADIIVISQMTPGPVSVNAATYVGFTNAGLIGSLFASAGVVMPSLILVLLVARFFFRFQEHPIKKAVFYGLRPVVAGLVFSAAIVIGQTSLIKESSLSIAAWFGELFRDPLRLISPVSILIFAATLFLDRKSKIHPLLLIAGAGVAGGLLFTFLPSWT